ncbi:antitoxin protein [Candidatus Scalindua japonica]|uniref:Antitoxin n=1 Tax=Candidatus Scalindua japonica TaxID=1284222 RepID=A0A286TUK4_9BACT|nr:type II toxin-antitoxin system Phd/YefM family antitoxin [Candidatus Scalindua japonica]GAX59556.1 antitoxin protein [Candidatus Scalindua japonica]
MSQTVSVAKMKSHLSEYIAKSTYKKERFIITRRNKQVAALINIDDLHLIEQKEERMGLASLIGKWKHFDEIEESLEDIPNLRKKGGTGRDVSL